MMRSPHSRLPAHLDVGGVIERGRAQFYRDANVVGVGVGFRRRDGQLVDEQCLIVYVRKKLPMGEVESSFRVPSRFEDLPTDVFAPFDRAQPKEALEFTSLEHRQASQDFRYIDHVRIHEQAVNARRKTR